MFRPSRSFLGATVLACLALGCNTQHYVGKAPRESSVVHTPPAAPSPRPLPAGSAEGVPEHLLHEYVDREPATEAEIRTWQLPFQAKRIAVALLILAAKDDLDDIDDLFTTHARWGFPDRREYDARPIREGGGREFFEAFREVASRFGRKEAFFCPPVVPPAAQLYVRNGAEPMWCAYLSRDGVDVLAFKFVYENGSAKIDYIGMSTNRGAPPRPGPKPPPMTPQIKRGTTPMPVVQLEQTGGGSGSTIEVIRRDGPPPPGTPVLNLPPGATLAPGTPPAATPPGTPPAQPKAPPAATPAPATPPAQPRAPTPAPAAPAP